MTPAAESSTPRAGAIIHEVDPETLKRWLDAGEAELFDVRETAEHLGERITGAALRPLSALERDHLPLEGTRRVVLHCASGNRSRKAAEAVGAEAPCELYPLRGGIAAWKAAGLATETSADAPLSMMRQVQLAAGSLVVVGTLLGAVVSPWFLALSGFAGAGLAFAGLTGTCGMATLLAKLPYNQCPTAGAR